jgi:lysophospholipase L1-like esterase
MQFVSNNKLLVFFIFLFVVLVAVLVANLVAVFYNGKPVSAPEIPREETTIGSGEELRYLILGDSTSIAQGGDYSQGFAVKTAENLAKTRKVIYKNYGVSGARINDVATTQLDYSKEFIPDIVLVAVGANDVTHLTSLESIESDLKQIINKLRERNNNVEIVFTGSASMGDVKRFIQPLRWFMGKQTERINSAFEQLVEEDNVKLAYIARETSEEFANNPKLFAQDNFHPNNEGYAVWVQVLNPVLEEAISK